MSYPILSAASNPLWITSYCSIMTTGHRPQHTAHSQHHQSHDLIPNRNKSPPGQETTRSHYQQQIQHRQLQWLPFYQQQADVSWHSTSLAWCCQRPIAAMPLLPLLPSSREDLLLRRCLHQRWNWRWPTARTWPRYLRVWWRRMSTSFSTTPWPSRVMMWAICMNVCNIPWIQ